MAVEYIDDIERTRLGTGFIKNLARVFGSISRAMEAEHTYNRLTNMTDQGLASRGIRQEDIPKIVIQQFFVLR